MTKQVQAQVPTTAYCYWLTGLPGAGKTTLAREIHRRLSEQGVISIILDGDQLRNGLSSDLGYSQSDRTENIRRIGEVTKLMIEAGVVVLVSAVSPYRADRLAVRDKLPQGTFFEVFVDADIDTCMVRDPKGLYRLAKAGQISNLTGFNDPYEVPEHPEFVTKTTKESPSEAAERIISKRLS